MNQTAHSAQKSEKECKMTNTEISDAMMKAFNEADWDTWRSFMAPDVTMQDFASGDYIEGVDAVMGYVTSWKSSFSNMIGTLENRIESGNTLVEECSWTGTNDGELPMPDGSKIPATGKSITIKNVLIFEMENGKCKSAKNYRDAMSMGAQLGLMG